MKVKRMLQFDGLSLYFICQQLEQKLTHGRVVKIIQNGKKSFTLTIRSEKENFNLFLCTDTQQAFVGFSEYKLSKEKESSSAFLLFLRKYLPGAFLKKISTYEAERLIFIDFEAQTDLGDKKNLRLVVELMGRQSNLILLNADQSILDSLIHVDYTQSKTREIMPARPYHLPAFQEKRSFINTSSLNFQQWIEEIQVSLKHPDSQSHILTHFKETFHSTSPLMLRYLQEAFEDKLFKENLIRFQEACIHHQTCSCLWFKRQNPEHHALIQLLVQQPELSTKDFFEQCSKIEHFDFSFVPYALKKEKTLPFIEWTEQHCFYYFPLEESLNFYSKHLTQLEQVKKLQKQKKNIQNYIQAERKQWAKKQKIYQEDFEKSKDFEREKIKGELLLCQSYLAPLGTTEALLENFYDLSSPKVKVSLDPALNAFQNAERFFNRSKKDAQKHEIAKVLLNFAKLQTDYLDSLEFHLSESQDEIALQDLIQEIQISKEQEMNLKDYIQLQQLEQVFDKNTKENNFSTKKSFAEREDEKRQAKSVGKPSKKSKAFQKYIQKNTKNNPKTPALQSLSKPHFFVTHSGFYLEIGKNNLQNDALVQKKYPKNCLWLHIQNQPGPHAVLYSPQGTVPDENALVEAAKMTAYFSLPAHIRKQKHERFEKMSVLYTDIKNVKKLKKAKPGLVQIRNEQSFYVIPEAVLEALPHPTDGPSQF